MFKCFWLEILFNWINSLFNDESCFLIWGDIFKYFLFCLVGSRGEVFICCELYERDSLYGYIYWLKEKEIEWDIVRVVK